MELNLDQARDTSNTKVGKPKRQRMKIIMEENVTSKIQGTMFGVKVNKERKYFMLLTDQPRLFLLSEFRIRREDQHPEPQQYRKDIMLYP